MITIMTIIIIIKIVTICKKKIARSRDSYFEKAEKYGLFIHSETVFCDESIGIRYTSYCCKTVRNHCFPNILRHFVGLVVKSLTYLDIEKLRIQKST